jgi:hypothetical protein
VEEGLMGEIKDPFQAVKWAAGIGWGTIFAPTQRIIGIKDSSGPRITDSYPILKIQQWWVSLGRVT